MLLDMVSLLASREAGMLQVLRKAVRSAPAYAFDRQVIRIVSIQLPVVALAAALTGISSFNMARFAPATRRDAGGLCRALSFQSCKGY